MYTSVNDFNNYVAALANKYNLEEYFRLIHSYFHNDIDISLMNKFIKYAMDPDIYCIDIDTLVEFELLEDSRGDVANLVIKYNLTEEVDYIIIDHRYEITTHTMPKEYKFTVPAFKVCLMMNNDMKFIKYFLLVESMFYYYKEYEILYNKNNEKNILTQLNNINNSILSNSDITTESLVTDNGYTDITESLKVISEHITSILIKSNVVDAKVGNLSSILDTKLSNIEKITNDAYVKCDDIDILLDNQMVKLQNQNQILQDQNNDLQNIIQTELRTMYQQITHIETITCKDRWYKRMFTKHHTN